MDSYSIASDHIQASVKTHGAELCRLRTSGGLDLLWDGDPAFWRGQSPVLFPVVGALKGGRLAVGDPQSVPAGKYGQAALEKLGLWVGVEPHLARSDSVRVALLRFDHAFFIDLDA